jgi:regulator of RNase E activity RraB
MNSDGIPNDATGDALRRMLDDGADLSKPHEIEYFVAIPNEAAGEHVASAASQIGFTVDVSKDDDDGPDWTCCCTKLMVPDHAAITSTEILLDSIAKQVGGEIDGWGAFSVS